MDVVSIGEETTKRIKGVRFDTISTLHSEGPVRWYFVHKSAAFNVI